MRNQRRRCRLEAFQCKIRFRTYRTVADIIPQVKNPICGGEAKGVARDAYDFLRVLELVLIIFQWFFFRRRWWWWSWWVRRWKVRASAPRWFQSWMQMQRLQNCIHNARFECSSSYVHQSAAAAAGRCKFRNIYADIKSMHFYAFQRSQTPLEDLISQLVWFWYFCFNESEEMFALAKDAPWEDAFFAYRAYSSSA